ncbi:MAG TPA: ACT domain-containing protein [Planctomycetota bacterium]|nr:ACT domain-containing protein [Planctomycetota bacterium]
MPIMTQLSIFLKNKPGVLGLLCEELAEHKVNILGLSVSDTVDHSVVRMLCDDAQKACAALGDAGMLVIETDVLVLDLPDKPGVLADVAQKLAKAKINIEYAYGTTEKSGGKLVLRVSDTKKAAKALKLKK